MKRIYLVPAGALLLATGILGWRSQLRQDIPIRNTGDGIPDAVTTGNVPAAMAQCRKVMQILQQNHWDTPEPCPETILNLLTLPDGKYSERASFRDLNRTNIAVTASDPETALFSPVYARQNRAYYKGDRSQAKPSGFYIVGYKKTGEVKQIPVEQVRVKSNPRPGEDVACFPEQSCYANAIPDSRYTKDELPR